MNNKKHWQSFGELNNTTSHQESTENEFKEPLLPMEEIAREGFMDSQTPRRDFLKYLGFSTALAAIAAGCEMPVRRSIPYLNKPDNVTPGVANYFASTYINGGDAISVVVKQRDGRPIKIEGNEASSLTEGGTNAQAQASVLDLYDGIRLRHPMKKSGGSFQEISSFSKLDEMISGALATVTGQIVLLTATIHSPSTLDIIEKFKAKYGAARVKHVQYDAISYSGMIEANKACYNMAALPSYHFEKAKTIVSLGADFLGTWLSPVEFSVQYAKTRRYSKENTALSRHFQFESMLSMTGSNADDRYTHKPSETGAVALALLAALGGSVSAPTIADAKLSEGIKKAATALKAGNGLVVCGSNDVNTQIIVNAINELIGANGNTINWATKNQTRKGIDADMNTLVSDLKAGTVGALLVYDCNPVYTHADGKNLASLIKKLPLSVSFNPTMDETTEQCQYVAPAHHWLESWGDAEPKTGYVSFIQPLINPLFKTRAFQSSLLTWMGGASAVSGTDSTAVASVSTNADYENYLRAYWNGKLTVSFDEALQKGIHETTAAAAGLPFINTGVAQAASNLASVKGGATEVVLYQKVSIGSGAQANNPWLQELPDPVSKVTWDNYAMISPAMAKTVLGIDVLNNQRQADAYEVTPEKPTLKITVAGKSVELPALILPGLNDSTIAIALGYGRKSADESKSLQYIGRSATGAGQNVYPFALSNGTNVIYNAVASVEKTGNQYPLAQTQVHGSSENRPVIYQTTLASHNKSPEAMLHDTKAELDNLLAENGKEEGFEKGGTIYPYYDKPGIKWGMSIDLNTCTGCSACVVACTAENNVSVVGKTQVQRAHEMHWLRIDRYFTGDPKNPDVVFQPMMCQHCDNAPCENVCPVAATNHSSEGLNQMTYNRCIGTRYCANNCPYKVRRFNWLDYTGSDSFADNQEPLRGKDLDESVFQMNEDLTRMVLNPDVTVRSRGVIEKCSFCVQRLQEKKLDAKKNEDPAIVRNVKTACMQACPTHAIQFGNVNDKESNVSKARMDVNRNFYVMEHLHVLPNVSYLAKIRNTDRSLSFDTHAADAKHDAHS
jgi:molybdopterin-containing oxidoreductase family iron-sulfur binding subunit